ncbi:hypothetical protein [Rhizobium grahamii]|uniref:HARP domain-containing protein n=2 Tax=Rhizobium grahamii TaxID=1120045 RepID=S3HTA4_9HYPH|nr:hypothetical protein [Rhizobium grahamii]EPE96456.1 hypothetical protein RGCCGE502_19940 [Rhizobium grahamii CCGE 502]RDJ03250.1 hypothetical protein B5K06_30085 [Rhizobium grahamii]
MEPKDKESNGQVPPVETVAFPFDRMMVARFREMFPRARWSDSLKAWTVPGKTARRRIDRWLSAEADRRGLFDQERGRDAYDFEPILSPYLEVHDTGFRIRTPFSRKVVEELRQVPFARWNSDDKAWEIPFASYDELQHRWEVIEGAAKRNEPDERRKRAAARKGSDEEAKARRRARERRRRRVPVPANDLPPVGRPVVTSWYGVVVITEVTGELIDTGDVAEFYPEADSDFVWAVWRNATLEELVHTWPAKTNPGKSERRRGWWRPLLNDLRDARRVAKTRERRNSLVSASSGPDIP